MKGFHVCKSGNAPTIGQVKSLIVVGDRIKSKALDQGGQNYTITSVTQRLVNDKPYTDSYGNVGYDIEIEPQNGTQSPQVATQRTFAPQSGDDRSNRIERQHSQDMMLKYFAMIGGFPEGKSATEAMREMTSWFQRDISRSPEKQQPETAITDVPPDEEPF